MKQDATWGSARLAASFVYFLGRIRRRLHAPMLRHVVCAMLVACGLATAGIGLATTYTYDANGRLTGVVNDSGQAARYSYDVMGNLLQVDRFNSGDVAIFSFTPMSGAIGSEVRIDGFGFSTTAASNQVAFNGVAASVLAATANQLRVVVPASATTGPITVTVGGVTATSSQPFTVTQSAQAPVITSVAPMQAIVGTEITVNGQRFNPISGGTSARLNGRAIQVNQLTDASFKFLVPPATGSGRVIVNTPYGGAVSSQDVVVIPSDFWGNLANSSPVRAVVDGAASSLATTSAPYAMLLFDGQAGAMMSMHLASSTYASNITYYVYGPDNRRFMEGTISMQDETSAHLRALPSTGTYTIIFGPENQPAAWTVQVERNKYMSSDGTAFSVNTTAPGQSERVLFSNTTYGKGYGVAVDNLATPGSTSTVGFSVRSYTENEIADESCDVTYDGCAFNARNLPRGDYYIVVHPTWNGNRTMSMQLRLREDVSGALVQNVAQPLSLPENGMNASLSFEGSAGHHAAIRVSSLNMALAGKYLLYTIYRPNGLFFISGTIYEDDTINTPLLPETGTYVLYIDPSEGTPASMQLLSAAEVASPIAINGAPVSLSTTTQGQFAYLGFSATAGQKLGLGISGITVSGTDDRVGVSVADAEGNIIGSTDCYASDGCDLNLDVPTTGTYEVTLSSAWDSTASFTATLSSDGTGSLSTGVAKPVSLTRYGSNQRLTFNATSGLPLSIQVASPATTPSGGYVYYVVLRPNGTVLMTKRVNTATTITRTSMPSTGTYTLFIDPEFGRPYSGQITLQ